MKKFDKLVRINYAISFIFFVIFLLALPNVNFGFKKIIIVWALSGPTSGFLLAFLSVRDEPASDEPFAGLVGGLLVGLVCILGGEIIIALAVFPTSIFVSTLLLQFYQKYRLAKEKKEQKPQIS